MIVERRVPSQRHEITVAVAVATPLVSALSIWGVTVGYGDGVVDGAPNGIPMCDDARMTRIAPTSRPARPITSHERGNRGDRIVFESDDHAASPRCAENALIGRPLGDRAFQDVIGRRLGRVVTSGNRGPKPKRQREERCETGEEKGN